MFNIFGRSLENLIRDLDWSNVKVQKGEQDYEDARIKTQTISIERRTLNHPTGAVRNIKVCKRSRIAELPSKIPDGFSRGRTLIRSTGTLNDVKVPKRSKIVKLPNKI